MSDSLNGLGSISLWKVLDHFEFFLDWASGPGYEFADAIRLLKFPGTVTEMIPLSYETPQKYSCQCTILSKAKEFELVEKFVEYQGRNKRFWFPSPINLFTLKTVAILGSTEFIVYNNFFDFRGFERIYFLLENGDFLTYKLDEVITDEDNNQITLKIEGSTDREIKPTDIIRFSLLLLARLDVDQLTINHKTATIGTCNLRFYELVKEYGEI